MSTSNFSNTINASDIYDIAIPFIGRFWLFLIPEVLSLVCCLFLLFHFLYNRTRRHALNNHVVIVLLFLCLIEELTDIPFTMNVYLSGVVWPQIPAFCMIWKFIDSWTYVAIANLVAWASVEQHILIFHNQWVSTKKKRLFFHYIPIITIVLYCIICYAIITPLNGCNKKFNYTFMFCGYSSCVYDSVSFSLYEFLSGGVLNSLLIGIGSISLILRIICQKRRFHEHIQWRKHRKMAIRLLSIVSLFYVLYLPTILLSIAKKFGAPPSLGGSYNLYAQFFSFYIVFLFPFACIRTVPQCRMKIKKLFRCCYERQTRAVVPEPLAMKTVRNN